MAVRRRPLPESTPDKPSASVGKNGPRLPVKPCLKILLVEVDAEGVEEAFPAQQQRGVVGVREAHGNGEPAVSIAHVDLDRVQPRADAAFLSGDDAPEFHLKFIGKSPSLAVRPGE